MTHRMTRQIPTLAAAALVVSAVLVATGCGAHATDKAGGAHVKTRVLTIASSNGDLGELQVWADAVKRLSDGRLKLKVRGQWCAGELHYETGMIGDVKAGKTDLGWVGSRAWPQLGVRQLDALTAPFLVTDYRVEAAILTDPIAKRMLHAVDETGVTGVALLPGPMRYLLSRRPVHGPGDLAGQTVSINESAVAASMFKALGARVRLLPAGGAPDGADALEQQLASIAGNTYARKLPYLAAAVPLYPRPFVVFANRRVWDGLDSAERAILTKAAQQSVDPMISQSIADDRRSLPEICGAGGRPTEADADALRAAVEPVYDELRRDRITRQAIAMAEASRNRLNVSAPALPTCPGAADVTGGLPTGRYTYTQRRSPEVVKVFPDDWTPGIRWIRLELRITARRVHIQSTFSDGRNVAGFDEGYSTYRDHVEFGGSGGPPISARWHRTKSGLRFTDINGGPDDKLVWGSQTWVRTDR